jgi:CubicO group peptidase (beta-lactamase class C family)
VTCIALLLAWLIVVVSSGPLVHADPIDDYITAEMAKRRIPGLALAVVKDGRPVRLQGYGVATLEHDVAVTPDTVFELASLTKQFTAAAIMSLVEEGKVGLDDLIDKHLTGAPTTWRGITVRHLLTHTGGFQGLPDGFQSLRADAWRANYSTKQLFDSAVRDVLGSAPGERFLYSDVGYFLAGMVIESASGRRYHEVLQERFWTPLGMTSTSVLDQWRVVKHRAAGYTIRDGQLINIRRISQVELPSHYGVFSSVRDLVKWEQAIAAGRVLRPDSLAQLWAPVRLTSGASFPYGLGWFIDERRGRRAIGHTGITGTQYSRYPDDDLAVIVLTNLGRQVGVRGSDVNPWGLTVGVVARYAPNLSMAAIAEAPDPDPAATRRLVDLFGRISRGDNPPEVTPPVLAALDKSAREAMAEALPTLQSFTYLQCDSLPPSSIGRRGDTVARRCYYRGVYTSQTRYHTVWFAPDGRVADFTSSVD